MAARITGTKSIDGRTVHTVAVTTDRGAKYEATVATTAEHLIMCIGLKRTSGAPRSGRSSMAPAVAKDAEHEVWRRTTVRHNQPNTVAVVLAPDGSEHACLQLSEKYAPGQPLFWCAGLTGFSPAELADRIWSCWHKVAFA